MNNIIKILGFKKIYMLIFVLIILTSCWNSENTEIINETSIISEKKVNRDISNDWSSLLIKKEEIKIEVKDWILESSDWVIISEWLPEKFPKNFPIYKGSKVYKNNKIPNYLITTFEKLNFEEIKLFYSIKLKNIWWDIKKMDNKEIVDNNTVLIFTKIIENNQKELTIHFSENPPKILSKNLWLKWKFIEIRYNTFEIEEILLNN